MIQNPKKSREELNAIREGQKRLAWIDNVKRINNMTQEEAEAAWAKIYATETDRKDGKP